MLIIFLGGNVIQLMIVGMAQMKEGVVTIPITLPLLLYSQLNLLSLLDADSMNFDVIREFVFQEDMFAMVLPIVEEVSKRKR